ncbi:MAG: FecR domain-containing protein [Candidatus Sericytochromatia bacterium]|nr:FecR domain-containing protein [Candidatus Sericytochromatia bacterium]
MTGLRVPNRRRQFLIALTLVAGLSLPALAATQTLPALDRLESRTTIPRDQVQCRLVTGSVQSRRGSGAWLNVIPDQLFSEGDMLRTGDKGMLVLELPLQAGFVNVLAGSTLGVTEMRRLPGFEGAQSSTLVLNSGKAFVRLRKFNRTLSRFRVNSPNGSAVVRGTEFVVGVVPGNRTTTIGVTSGMVQVSAQDKTVDVRPGNTTTIVADNAPTAVMAVAATPIRLQRFLPKGDSLDIIGSAAPGSSIVINGLQVEMNPAGTFTATIPLSAAASQVTIESLEPTGHVETLSVSAGQ